MRLAWQNKADASTLTAGSEITTLPATNVQKSHLSRRWHTLAGVKSSYLQLDMGSQVACSLFALLGTNISENGSMRLRASPTVAAMTSDVVFDTGTISASRRKVLSLPGVAGNYASTPDSPGYPVTGDLDFKLQLAANWRPGVVQIPISKWTVAGNQRSWLLFIQSNGTLTLYISTTGADETSADSSAAVPATDPIKHIRVTRKASSGDVKFYTSYDGETWTQLGTTQTLAAGVAMFDSAAPIVFSGHDLGAIWPFAGEIFYAEVRNGIDGRVIARFDPDADAEAGDTSVTSSVTREIWTINQSGTPGAAIVVNDNAGLKDGYAALYKAIGLAYLNLPGIGGNYASTPDSAANSVTGDLDIRIKMAMDDLTPGAGAQVPISKWWDGGSPQSSYLVFIDIGGAPQLYWSEDGSALLNAPASAAPAFADSAAGWLRIILDVDNGAAGRDIKFYTSVDYNPATGEGTWTQLGATVTQAGVTSIFNGTEPLLVGAYNRGASPFAGKIYYAEIRSGIDGTVVAAFDPSRAAASGDTTLTAATGEVWTINQSGSPKAELLKDESVTARYWRLDLTDHSLADNLQVGRLFLGPGWEPSIGQLYDWSVTALDESQVAESYGGQSFPDARPQKRVLEFVLDFMGEAEMYGNAFALARSAGVVREVLAIPDVDGAYVSEQAVYGLCTASQPLIRRHFRIFRQKFSIKERL